MSRAFRSTRESYNASFYCSICNLDQVEQKFIPIAQWAKENNYTIDQCRSLLRKKILLGFRSKRKMYVMVNPNGKEILN